MSEKKSPAVHRDWLAKSAAGILCGGVMAFACSGLFARLNAPLPLAIRGQLAMWMVPPIWLGVLSGVYFFSSGLRAWLGLGGASVFVVGTWLAVRFS